MPPHPYNYHWEPIRSLWIIYSLLFLIFLKLPYWLIISVPRSGRLCREWTYGRSMHVRIVKWAIKLSDRTGELLFSPDHRAIPTNLPPHVQGVWVEGIPDHLIVGQIKDWAELADIRPMRIPGYWYQRPGDAVIGGPARRGEKIALNLHGGAYITFSAHPNDISQNITRGILSECPSINRIFSLEYRLSSTAPYKAEFPFPAAVLDALSGYYYLIETVGVSPDDLVIIGDSAGANLALALIRYLIRHPLHPLPIAKSLLLLSPWCEMGPSHMGLDSSFEDNKHTDYIRDVRGNMAEYSLRAYCAAVGLQESHHNPYISPASRLLPPEVVRGLFEGFPKTMIIAGSGERLLDSIRTLRDRFLKDVGQDGVQYLEVPNAIHDFCVFPWYEPERSTVLKAVEEWLREKRG
ncbi:alpha/beta-hydrolase [Sistotremastrum niveocremeum HHB9708]|uniref:Alpha/beta-hydrolase n=1 Tax=Sistotremastrum niveocremeum HHB9708 TaxID=1314777 RepID=A0A164ZVI9_9AGAM|nr:alpha/beta-hydrolase [Sistotremastrum niveocremeum HHB9708]